MYLTGHYRKFVRGYGLLARHLRNLLKKGQFCWDSGAEAAFKALKHAMTQTPVLFIPNFKDVFIIETDVLGDGIGAVLQQNGKPIAFMSRALGVTKKAWSTYANEMLEVVEVVRIWRPYLLGQWFVIQTKERSLKYLLEQKKAIPEQQKWMVKLMGYDYEIRYRPGKENNVVDALSRRLDNLILNHLFISQISLWGEIRKVALEDEYLKQLTQQIETQSDSPYTAKNGIIFFKGRVVIPKKLRETLLYEAHDTKTGGMRDCRTIH